MVVVIGPGHPRHLLQRRQLRLRQVVHQQVDVPVGVLLHGHHVAPGAGVLAAAAAASGHLLWLF